MILVTRDHRESSKHCKLIQLSFRSGGFSGESGDTGLNGANGGLAGYYIYNRALITFNNSGTVAGR